MYSRSCQKVNDSFTFYGLAGSLAGNQQFSVLVRGLFGNLYAV